MDRAGKSVDISNNGNIIAIGAYLNDSNGDSAGQVRVFEYNSNNERWEQLGQTLNGSSSDLFGASVTLSSDGKTIGVGGPLSNIYYQGSARVFRLSDNNSQWSQLGNTINGIVRDGNFGSEVELSNDGNIIAVGMPGEVQIFRLENQMWMLLGGIIDGYEVSLAKDGLLAAVRSPNGGVVRVLEYLNDKWTQVGDNISGSPDRPEGTYMAMSQDGTVLASTSIIGSTADVIIYKNGSPKVVDLPRRSRNPVTSSSTFQKPNATALVVSLILTAFNALMS